MNSLRTLNARSIVFLSLCIPFFPNLNLRKNWVKLQNCTNICVSMTQHCILFSYLFMHLTQPLPATCHPISRVHCIFNQGVNSAHCKGASELVLLAASAKIYCSEVEIIRHKHGKKGLRTVQGFFSLSTGANFIFFCCNHAFNLASSTFC